MGAIVPGLHVANLRKTHGDESVRRGYHYLQGDVAVLFEGHGVGFVCQHP
jgi:hypothetical protein